MRREFIAIVNVQGQLFNPCSKSTDLNGQQWWI